MSKTAHSVSSTLHAIGQALASLIGYPPIMRGMVTRRLHG